MNLEAIIGSVKLKNFIAGLAGGVVATNLNNFTTIFKSFLLIISGGLIAAYTTDALMHIYQLDDALSGSIAFMLGLMGMKIIPVVYENIGVLVKAFLKYVEHKWFPVQLIIDKQADSTTTTNTNPTINSPSSFEKESEN